MNPEQLLEAALEGQADGYGPWGSPMSGCGLRLRGLLAGVRVVVDEDTPTLSISQDARGHVLRVGPAFCRRHVRSPADARLVVAHELLHAVRGHLLMTPDRHPGLRSLQNLALDILVNAAALQWAMDDEHPGLLARLYPVDSFPGCLLVPPSDLLPMLPGRWPSASQWQGCARMHFMASPDFARRVQDAVARHLAGLGVRHAEAFARAYLRGWFDFPEPEGYWAHLRALFITELGIDPEPPELLLLGCHDGGPIAEALRDEVCEQLSRSESWFGKVTVEAPSREEIDRFCREVARAIDRSAGGRITQTSPATLPTPLPMPGRRDLPLLTLGMLPALWHPRLPRRSSHRGGVRVYVDVSGSMERITPLLFGLMRALGSRLELPAWAWSLGTPEPLDGDDLSSGHYRTRVGTDFAPVVGHAVERGFRRLVVLTDGVFRVSPEMEAQVDAAGLEITFALAGQRPPRTAEGLRRLAKHVFELGGGWGRPRRRQTAG